MSSGAGVFDGSIGEYCHKILVWMSAMLQLRHVQMKLFVLSVLLSNNNRIIILKIYIQTKIEHFSTGIPFIRGHIAAKAPMTAPIQTDLSRLMTISSFACLISAVNSTSARRTILSLSFCVNFYVI